MPGTGGSHGAKPLDNAVLIAGPTASGKSALAVRLAAQTDGVVINADSMQVYSVLNRLTARPTETDLAAAPHRLYGHVSPSNAYSAGLWLADVASLIRDELDGRRAIFVGGTGLYFKALVEGLSEMPDIPAEVRASWRQRLADDGAPALHRMLAERDGATAARLSPRDGQRIVRALEVIEASGRPIGDWQGRREMPLVARDSASMLVIEPDRQELSERIEARLHGMAAEGALDEVEELRALGLDASMPAMKAIGVREFGAVLDGDATMDGAIADAAAATRRYAKRQGTWFRHQLRTGWTRCSDPARFSLY